MTELKNDTAVAADEEKQAFADALRGRGATYAFLGRMFRKEADQELLDTLKRMRFVANTGNAQVDEGNRLIVNYLNHSDANVLNDLAIDYVHAFIGSGNDAYSAAYPYESVYTSPKRLTMQDARDEVLALYRAAGLDKKDDWKDGEDHIALEMEYLQILNERALVDWEAGNEREVERNLLTQRNFLTDHLMAWYPMMAGDIQKYARTDFYKGLGTLTTGFLSNEREFFDEVFGKPEQAEEDSAENQVSDAASDQTADEINNEKQEVA